MDAPHEPAAADTGDGQLVPERELQPALPAGDEMDGDAAGCATQVVASMSATRRAVRGRLTAAPRSRSAARSVALPSR
jgi:hypothetical protein